MSKLGKNLVWIALAGVLVSAVFAFMVVSKNTKVAVEKEKAIKALNDKTAELQDAQKKLTDDQASLAETTARLAETKSKADALQADLAAVQKKTADLQESLQSATEKMSQAEKKVKAISDSFDGKSPEEVKSATLKAQAELLAAQTDRKQLENQLQSAKSEVARVTDALRRTSKGEMPPGLSGKIQSISKNWNFVVLNLGDKDGVVRNAVFVVYRNKTYIGRVKVSSTEANTCVADIIPEATKGEIRIGDDALN